MNCNILITNPSIIKYGQYLYFSSRSLRLATRCLESVVKRSHVSMWKWIQKYSNLDDRIKTDRHHSVKAIFVDETMIRIDGQDYYWLWIACEPNLDSYLMICIYQEKGRFSCMLSILYAITK
jgi:putative transposase